MNNEVIEAAKAVIARWDSTDWKAAPTAEVMNRLRAALATKLPEVEEWIVAHCDQVSDYSKKLWIDTDTIRTYIAKLTAAHAAELNNLHAQVGDLLAISATAKEQGQRETLMGMPVDALIYAAQLLRLDTGNIESVVNSKTVSEYEISLSRLVESARAAQQEKTK